MGNKKKQSSKEVVKTTDLEQKLTKEEVVETNNRVEPSNMADEKETGRMSSKEEILKIKEERFLKDDENEEEEVKKDTKFRRILRSIGYFWDYYKWYVIIPLLIIIIVVTFIDNYLKENRNFALRIAIVNESEVVDTLNTIDAEYPAYRGLDPKESPIRIEYDFSYPKERMVATNISREQVTYMQKFNAMVVGGKADVVISNTWLLDDYSVNKNMVDLRNVFDEEFMTEYEDRLYWYISDEGERFPVGIYVDDCDFLTEFEKGEPAVIAIFDGTEHTEESAEFVKWILQRCTGDLSNWIYA